MNTYVIHATIYKCYERSKAEIEVNVKGFIEAETENEAKNKAKTKFTTDYAHPKISNIRVKIDFIIEILSGASLDEVNIDLYTILRDNESHLRRTKHGIEAYTFVYSYDIRDFVKAVGDHYFDEGGVDCRLLIGGDICIRIDPIITESEEHLLSSYSDCFEEWEEYKDEILKEEQNG